uniref:helix-turn-helix transcriptional regulator n=1 Tax=Altererythrobacter segetis TaxID=1104773 RepID=UPI0014077337|nr:LuxR C-terminal-related transcriptional regulator [Altererythrobacter segetis]
MNASPDLDGLLPSAPMLAAALDLIADAVAIVRADGRVVFANRAMHRALDERRLLGMYGGRLAPCDPEAAPCFGRMLCAASRGKPVSPLALPSPGRPATIKAEPLEGGARWPAGKALLLVALDDPQRPLRDGVDRIARQFGLTPREATIGAHLAAGWRIGEIASTIGVSRNTVRSHAALLREKLGEHSALAVAARFRSATAI